MNKPLKQDQLELETTPTPTQKRKLLIAGVEDYDKKFPPESPEEAVDNAIAKRVVSLLPGTSFVEDDPDAFNWDNPDEDSIVLREQRATAVYRNRIGDVVIRQRCWPDDDSFLYISPENEIAFMEGIAEKLRK